MKINLVGMIAITLATLLNSCSRPDNSVDSGNASTTTPSENDKLRKDLADICMGSIREFNPNISPIWRDLQKTPVVKWDGKIAVYMYAGVQQVVNGPVAKFTIICGYDEDTMKSLGLSRCDDLPESCKLETLTKVKNSIEIK